MVKEKFQHLLLLIVLTVSLSQCGGGGGEERDEVIPEPGISGLGTSLLLRFTFSFQSGRDIVCVTAPCGTGTTFAFPDEYAVPLYLDPTGELTLRAQEFPRMVLRLCNLSTDRDDCDLRLNDNRLSQGADLVLDLCGSDRNDDECGDEGDDPTLFEGSITPEGRMLLTGINVRIRVFLLGTSGPDGHSASDTAGGILLLPRLTVVTQTDPAINTGILSGIGERIADQTVTLVSGGILPAEMQELGGTHYLSTMIGTFDVDPLSLLE